MSNSDPTSYGGSAILQNAAYEQEQYRKEQEQKKHEKLLNQSRSVRFITQEGLLKQIRNKAIELRDEALQKIEDYNPADSKDSPEVLMREYKTHQIYVKMFDNMEKDGREAGKQLKEQGE